MNIHTHYLNGVAFTHSHPNHGEHSHSNADLLLLSRLSVFYSLKVDADSPHTYQQTVLRYIETARTASFRMQVYGKNITLRAPPHFLS